MAAARAALICSLATAPVMGTTLNQRAAMVVASPSFVVVLALRNHSEDDCESNWFRCHVLLLASDRMSQLPGKEGLKESL